MILPKAIRPRSIRAGVLGLLLALWLLAGFPAAWAETVSVTGQVKGPGDAPRPFVSVSLVGPGRYSAMTNAEGIFKIRDVIPGKYEIRVRRGDFLSEFSRVVDEQGAIEDLVVKW